MYNFSTHQTDARGHWHEGVGAVAPGETVKVTQEMVRGGYAGEATFGNAVVYTTTPGATLAVGEAPVGNDPGAKGMVSLGSVTAGSLIITAGEFEVSNRGTAPAEFVFRVRMTKR